MVKVYESYEWMRLKYVTQRKTEQQIADEAGTTQVTINRWLVKHKLKRNR